jgi:Kef-type K+ transport system membrane component KefB
MTSSVVTLIVQIVVIILAATVVGALFQKINQPRVIGEMVAGILLGPSLLGWLAPNVSHFLFPPASLSYLNILSQIGMIIYMFLVGLALNPKELRRHGHAAVLTSHVSIVVPFVLGVLLALYLYPRLSDDSVTFTTFALFMGAAMSITAFPVLARILTERNMLGSRLGTLAIACAAVDDASGWCILASLTVLIRAQRGPISVWLTIIGSPAYVLFMVYGVRRLLRRFQTVYEERACLSHEMTALLVLLALASALATQRLGIHFVFGAFLVGAVMPKDRMFVRHVGDKFESLTVILFLPLFFAFTGLRMSINAMRGGQLWLYCLAIIVVAVTGKLGGSMTAARAAGVHWREAAGLGILMNTRGLMELVVLNIGLDMGIISPVLFSMMVLMALVTTFMTTPLLEWLYPSHLTQEGVCDFGAEQVA